MKKVRPRRGERRKLRKMEVVEAPDAGEEPNAKSKSPEATSVGGWRVVKCQGEKFWEFYIKVRRAVKYY